MSVQGTTLSSRPLRPAGLGGWLHVPMIGMIGTPLLQLFRLTQTGQLFATVDGFGPLGTLFVTTELALRLALLLAAPTWLLVLFFKRDRRFPKLYIHWQTALGIFVLLDWLLSYALFHTMIEGSHLSFFDPVFLRPVATAAVGVFIWSPYMAKSVRVKNTFVN